MRYLFIVIYLILEIFISCKTKKDKPYRTEMALAKDSLWLDSAAYVQLLDTTLDSAAYIKAFSEFAIQKLIVHPNQHYFDTSALVRDYNAHISFYQGKIFSNDKYKAVVQVHDLGRNPFFIFTKTDKWRLKQVFYGYGISEDEPEFSDYNFDGYKDLCIFWNYTSGRCSCSNPGCRDIYLYDNAKDSFIDFPEVGGYLDFGISTKERALYFGEHCDGIYKKFKWHNGILQKVEEFIHKDKKFVNNKDIWILEHNFFKNNIKTKTIRRKNAEMLKSWKKIFKI